MCCRMLVEEGHEEFRKINCKYTTVKDDTRKMLLEDGEENDRVVCDYIAGMTVSYAVKNFTEFFIPESWKN